MNFKLPITCVAQDVDNRGADTFALRGALVDPSNETAARQAVNLVSEVTMSTRPGTYGPGKLEAYVVPGRFVLDVPVLETDSRDRNAAFAALVDVPEDADGDFADSLHDDLVAFARAARRTITPGLREVLPELMTAATAKKKWRRPRRAPADLTSSKWLTVLVVATAVALFLAWLLAYKDA